MHEFAFLQQFDMRSGATRCLKRIVHLKFHPLFYRRAFSLVLAAFRAARSRVRHSRSIPLALHVPVLRIETPATFLHSVQGGIAAVFGGTLKL